MKSRLSIQPLRPEVARLVLMLVVLALLALGMVMVYSASSVTAATDGVSGLTSVISQLVSVGVGVVLAIAVWRWVPRGIFVGCGVWVIWGAAMLLLVLTLVLGREVYGAKRWIALGPLTLQGSEFAKIALLCVAVRLVSEARHGQESLGRTLTKAVVFVLLPLLFIYKFQSDLGTTVICAVGVLAIMLIGGVSLRVIGTLAALSVGFAAVAIFGTSYRSDRLVFLDPWNDGEGGYGAGYNIIRSFYALAEGGLFGVGLGNSHEKYSYLFASDSDFIYAVIGEELGLIGAVAVIVLFGLLLYAGLSIARNASDDESMMLAGGCTIMLASQAFLNIGCVIGALPTTGKPLPFVSSGGSSMLASMMMVGIILMVSREGESERVYERRRDRLRVVRSTDSFQRPSSSTPRWGYATNATYLTDRRLSRSTGGRSRR